MYFAGPQCLVDSDITGIPEIHKDLKYLQDTREETIEDSSTKEKHELLESFEPIETMTLIEVEHDLLVEDQSVNLPVLSHI
ncbi:hypothetical protein J5N97_007257 [Dioscorea zingiberensis]|uniref:Uncharacterized protein n=1 Tax=Dioscorea zingiberensis TaxID=325984 RepID=A0A9D5DBN5_9LILI|nr:hypothetical protein J5N97_007257 [Dioscorea zingiberensis]